MFYDRYRLNFDGTIKMKNGCVYKGTARDLIFEG
jgi:hypothetical protein